MHELAITENMLKIVLQYARASNAQRVTDLYLTLGDLSSIEALEFHWGQISRGSVAENAKIHFEIMPTHLYCRDCNDTHEYHPDHETIHNETYECPVCKCKDVEIVQGGGEYRLTAIDIND
jgi:hydrogenase nickel incorporation protein HypA/HybF